MQYYGMLSERVKEISASDANLQSERPHFERILKHFEDEENIESDGTVLPEQYHIDFKNVTFAYSDVEANVLENLSFHISAGDRVAFCGESGAGKSTVLKLMLGQLQPDSGDITYGNVSVKDICKKKLYEKIAYISQNAKLYNESILENLCLGNESVVTEETATGEGICIKKVEEACRQACIYDFIMSQPEGFLTRIGENGEKLSGGQRQRLLLAKALLRDAELYIFDEATSALDGQTEEAIMDTLKYITKNKTVIIVSHKERLLRLCDECEFTNKIAIGMY